MPQIDLATTRRFRLALGINIKMQYLDPLPVSCKNCGKEDKYDLKTIVKLEAKCKYCHYDFTSIGNDIRKNYEDWGTFVGRIELAMELEEQLQIQYSDKELAEISIIGEFIDLTSSKLSRDYNYKDLKNLIFQKLSILNRKELSDFNVNMKIYDALYPNHI